jgi:hypothetical protein
VIEIENYRMNRFLTQMAGIRAGMLAILCLLLASCSQPEIQPLIFNAAPWQPNEVSTYQVTDVNGNYAGTARYDLTQLEGDLWNLRREISAQGTQEIVTVDMTQPGFRPSQSTLVRIAGNDTEQVHADYNGSEVNLELTTKQNVTTFERVSIPSDAREQASLIMLLRALPLAESYAVRLNVFLPIVGILDRVTVSVVGREQVTTPAGTYECWLVRMETADSRTEAWIATQAPYPVVRFIDSRNDGTFELSEFQPGQ